MRDGYIGYEKALLLDGRFDAGCMAHSRRKFDELFKANASPVTLRWIAGALSDAKGRFRKLRGHRDMKLLLAVLKAKSDNVADAERRAA